MSQRGRCRRLVSAAAAAAAGLKEATWNPQNLCAPERCFELSQALKDVAVLMLSGTQRRSWAGLPIGRRHSHITSAFTLGGNRVSPTVIALQGVPSCLASAFDGSTSSA